MQPDPAAGRARLERVILLLALLLALAVRLYRLDAQSLWNDEGTSVALALRDLGTIARDASHDIHPPLYYFMLHGWVRLFGTGEAPVRALSAIAGVGLVAGTWLYARRRGPGAAALAAVLLAALSPLQVYYSQEARMYAWVALWGLLSMLAFNRLLVALDEGRRRLVWSVWYVLATLAALYTHYYAVTLVFAQNAIALIWLLAHAPTRSRPAADEGAPSGRSLLWRWIVVQLGVLLAYAPWLLYAQAALRSWPAVSAPLSLTQVLDLLRALALGLTVPARLRTLVAALALWAVALMGVLPRRTLCQPTGDRAHAPEPWYAAPLYLGMPVGAMLLLSLRRPMLNPKFLLLATPALYVLLGRGVARLGGWVRRCWGTRPRFAWARYSAIALATAAIAAPALLSLRALYTDPATYRDDYRAILAYVRATAGPSDALLVNAPGQMDTVDYYGAGHLAVCPLPQQRPLDRHATEDALQALSAAHPRIYGIFWGTDESDPERVIEGWLDQHCFKTMDSWFGNVRLVVYAVPLQPTDEIAVPRSEQFGEQVRLLGYTLLTPAPSSGDILQLALYWEALQASERRLKVFVHLVDARGNIVAQRDSEPAGGSRPTSDWATGERIIDRYGLWIQPGTPPGVHTLRIGWYDPATGQRLMLSQAGRELGDALDMATITVQRAAVAPPLAALDRQHADDLCWPGACLVGHNLHRLGFEHEAELQLRPGDQARLVLFWQEQCDGVAPAACVVTLERRRGEPLWQQTLERPAPGDPCQSGDIQRTIHALALPADLAAGEYRLTMRLPNEAPGAARLLQVLRLQ
ncbi:MAG: hypothetical protein GX557_01350 [Chloroflexi bacterium]|nr:hypothetical protein [Chloroflexota bacterium]